MYGYINDTKPQPQTFEPSSVVMLSDGLCGSTCAIFAELLKSQAGVQSIVVGGRKQTGPMQSVGGSKGSNDQDLSRIVDVASQAYADADKEQQALFEPYVNAGLTQAAQQVVSLRKVVTGVG